MDYERIMKDEILHRLIDFCQVEGWDYEKRYEHKINDELEFVETDELEEVRFLVSPPDYKWDLEGKFYVQYELCGQEAFDIVIQVSFGYYICDDRKQNLINEFILRAPSYIYNIGGLKFDYGTGELYLEFKRTYSEDMLDCELKEIINQACDMAKELFGMFREVYTEKKTPKRVWDEKHDRWIRDAISEPQEVNEESSQELRDPTHDRLEDFTPEQIQLEDIENIARLNNIEAVNMVIYPKKE